MTRFVFALGACAVAVAPLAALALSRKGVASSASDGSPGFAVLPRAPALAPWALAAAAPFGPFFPNVLKPIVTPQEVDATPCPKDMVEVEGDYCPFVEQRCLRWLDGDGANKLRCAEFAVTGKCTMKTDHKRFCIDRYEWPGKVGEKPIVAIDWHFAGARCKEKNKRLCLDSEWTLACEGQERLPYTYGYSRNSEACNIDKFWRKVDFQAYADLRTRAAEVAKLDQRDPIGSHEACVSPYGAFDMAGNVDEWVINESGQPFKSGLKGGYWGPVRTRCRPMTISHEETFSFYQVGFRCCGDIKH